MAMSRKAGALVLFAIAGIVFTVMTALLFVFALSIREKDQPWLVNLMYDTFYDPEQTATGMKALKQENPFGFRLYRVALRSCLEKTLEQAQAEREVIERPCRAMPSWKCQQDMAFQASKIQMSLYPLLLLEDPDGFLENPVIREHQRMLPILRASRDAAQQFTGASNRAEFMQQVLPLVKSLC